MLSAALLWAIRLSLDLGEREAGQHSSTCVRGSDAAKQLTTADRRVTWPEESSLFSLTSLAPRITAQLVKGVRTHRESDASFASFGALVILMEDPPEI